MFSPDFEKRILQHCSPIANNLFSSYESASTPTPLDRFIPCRSNNNWQTHISSPTTISIEDFVLKHKNKIRTEETAYSCLLKNELLGTAIDDVKLLSPKSNNDDNPPKAKRNLFKYQLSNESDLNTQSAYSLSPVGTKSHKLLQSFSKTVRKISPLPYKVLDAPELKDDYYLNLVDWSAQNVLAVGLDSSVYLWNASTSLVTRLCDLKHLSNSITSVSWNDYGNLVAIGTNLGYIMLWDIVANKQIRKIDGHSARVGTLAWNYDVLSSGSLDRRIIQRDIRAPNQQSARCLVHHRQEVCGLKYSVNCQYLASGGNDNCLAVWDQHSVKPVQCFNEHNAAVKAIAWSPHHHEILASGGGTSDRCIRFWNSLTGQQLQHINTGSQVCNLVWSKYSNEFVSTHGYSQNQILVWRYPSLRQIAKLSGHSFRVLYLALGPDGESIVTGAGDETLRFWKVFCKQPYQIRNKSILNLFQNVR